MNRRPVHVVRFGTIKASIWQNQTKAGDRFNVSLVRVYKNGERWVESSLFGRNDLLLVAKAADLAHSWIFEHGQADSVSNTVGSNDKHS